MPEEVCKGGMQPWRSKWDVAAWLSRAQHCCVHRSSSRKHQNTKKQNSRLLSEERTTNVLYYRLSRGDGSLRIRQPYSFLFYSEMLQNHWPYSLPIKFRAEFKTNFLRSVPACLKKDISFFIGANKASSTEWQTESIILPEKWKNQALVASSRRQNQLKSMCSRKL